MTTAGDGVTAGSAPTGGADRPLVLFIHNHLFGSRAEPRSRKTWMKKAAERGVVR